MMRLLNYNESLNLDDGSCEYPVILGCTDPEAVEL